MKRLRWLSPFAALTCLGTLARAESDYVVDLSALARASVRPEECGGAAHAQASRWDRAKTPGLGAYCDALSRGYASLRVAPAEAAASAALAERALPGRAAPQVLLARSSLRLGKDAEASEAFARALAFSPKALDAPGALHDFAITQIVSGRLSEALASYRVLVPRAELLGDRREEVSVLVEAGILVMTAGKDALPEAIGYLTEARRRSPPLLKPTVLAALSLALDRAGRQGEAQVVAAEAGSVTVLEAEKKAEQTGSRDVLALPPGEREAMIGMVLEQTDDRDRAVAAFKESAVRGAAWKAPFLDRTKRHADGTVRAGKP